MRQTLRDAFDIKVKQKSGDILSDYEVFPDKKLLDKNVKFEVNYGAIARGYRTVPYPEKRLLTKIKDAGKEIVYTSDCHKKEQLLFGIDE